MGSPGAPFGYKLGSTKGLTLLIMAVVFDFLLAITEY